jgi:hypothetical protein
LAPAIVKGFADNLEFIWAKRGVGNQCTRFHGIYPLILTFICGPSLAMILGEVQWPSTYANTISGLLKRRAKLMADARELRKRMAVVGNDIAALDRTLETLGYQGEMPRANRHPEQRPRRLLPPQRIAARCWLALRRWREWLAAHPVKPTLSCDGHGNGLAHLR